MRPWATLGHSVPQRGRTMVGGRPAHRRGGAGGEHPDDFRKRACRQPGLWACPYSPIGGNEMNSRRRLIRQISLMMGLTAAITSTSAWAPNCGAACTVSRSARIPLHGSFFDANSDTTISLEGLVHVVSQAMLTDTFSMLALHAEIASADVKVTAVTGSRSHSLGAAVIQDVRC